MMKSSTSFGFSSSLLFFFVAATVVNSQIGTGGCMYRLEFETGTDAEAGTDSNIKVIFGNSNGDSVEIPNLTSAPGDLEKGKNDIFYFQAPCMTSPITNPVCNITVTSDGSGQRPGWYLENVRVYSFKDPLRIPVPLGMTDFIFNQWLAIDEPPYQLTASRDVCPSS